MIEADIPRIDQPRPDAAPRSVRFRDAAPAVRRRRFLAVAGTAGMTLGLTVLGWIPLARPARAEQGSEYLDCGHYRHRPGSPICYGAPYSSSYCGSDHWFKNGCVGNWKDGLDCYQPRAICRANGEPRNGWRWKDGDTVYRCADGEVHYAGAPNFEQLICSATLSDEPSNSSGLP